MWKLLTQEFLKRKWRVVFLVGLVFVVAFSIAFAYDEYYNEKNKSLTYAVQLSIYIFGGCIISAVVLSFAPLAAWGFKVVKGDYVLMASKSATAKHTIVWPLWLLLAQVILGLVAGSFLGDKFMAGIRAFILWVVELAKSLKGFFT